MFVLGNSCECFLAHVSGLLSLLLSLVLHVVSLLLHIVGNVDLRKQNFLASCNGNLLIGLFLTNLSHLLSGTVVVLLFLEHVVSLSLLKESFLLNAISIIIRVRRICEVTYSRPSISFFTIFKIT